MDQLTRIALGSISNDLTKALEEKAWAVAQAAMLKQEIHKKNEELEQLKSDHERLKAQQQPKGD